jgi:hypothetical protein
MTQPLRTTLAVVAALGLAAGTVVTQLKHAFVWQVVGSFLGLLALTLLLSAAASAYPFLGGRPRLGGRILDLGEGSRRLLPATLVICVAVGVLAPLLLGQMPL